jgi:hypothetical protein
LSAKINQTIRFGGRSYKRGQEDDLRSSGIRGSDLKRLQKDGLISGFGEEDSGEAKDEGLSEVKVQDLRTALGKIEDADEVRRLRDLEQRSTAISHYDARLGELEGE